MTPLRDWTDRYSFWRGRLRYWNMRRTKNVRIKHKARGAVMRWMNRAHDNLVAEVRKAEDALHRPHRFMADGRRVE